MGSSLSREQLLHGSVDLAGHPKNPHDIPEHPAHGIPPAILKMVERIYGTPADTPLARHVIPRRSKIQP
jgi:hypothetical protein